MWKANGKTTTLSLFLDSLFPKTEIPYMRPLQGTKKSLNPMASLLVLSLTLVERGRVQYIYFACRGQMTENADK
jgi:hypothetical protein